MTIPKAASTSKGVPTPFAYSFLSALSCCNTALKLTTAKYFTPSGESIDGVGIKPDVTINQTTLPQNNKAVIIKNEQVKNNQHQLVNTLADLQLVKAKQLLSMQ